MNKQNKQLIRKDYYEVSFDSSKKCFDTIRDPKKNWFVIGGKYRDIVIKTDKHIEIIECEDLQKATVSNEILLEKIKNECSQYECFCEPKIEDTLTLNEEMLIIKGTFDYGYDYSYFAVYLTKEDKVLIELSCDLLRVLLLDGTHYFVTHWQKMEACAEGVFIYRVENGSFVEVFNYGQDT